MNRNEFVAEVLHNIGNRHSEDETVLLEAGGSNFYLVYEWIYRAERRIAARHDFESMRDETETLTTTADVATGVALSGIDSYTKSIETIRVVDGTSSYPLVYRTPQWMDMNFPDIASGSSNKPTFYTLKAKVIFFNCMPNDTYTLRVNRTKWPSKMSSGTSVSSFGEHLVDHVIVEYATGNGFNSLGEAYVKDANYHYDRGDQFLSEMLQADNFIPDQIVTTGGYRRRSGGGNALESGSFPSGTVNPFRR